MEGRVKKRSVPEWLPRSIPVKSRYLESLSASAPNLLPGGDVGGDLHSGPGRPRSAAPFVIPAEMPAGQGPPRAKLPPGVTQPGAARRELWKSDFLKEQLTSTERRRLRAVFHELDVDKDGKLGVDDLHRRMRHMHVSRADVSTMIWEIDEDADGKIGLRDFATAYVRAKLDPTGTAPRSLYNFILYRMIDKDNDGDISNDEVYQYVFPQMKKGDVQRLMSRLFPEDAHRVSVHSATHATLSPNGRRDGPQCSSDTEDAGGSATASITAQQFVRIMQSRLWSHTPTQFAEQPRDPYPLARSRNRTAMEKLNLQHRWEGEFSKTTPQQLARECFLARTAANASAGCSPAPKDAEWVEEFHKQRAKEREQLYWRNTARKAYGKRDEHEGDGSPAHSASALARTPNPRSRGIEPSTA